MTGYVDRGEAPGVQTLVWRRGELAHRDLIGRLSLDGDPVRPDALYRLSSLTKPVVTVAALTLVEEGRLRLSDRIDRWLPEFAAPRVLKDPGGPLEETIAAPRPITVADLLTHRAGLATPWLPQGPIGQAMQRLVGVDGPRADLNEADWIARLAELPLLHAPGERLVMGFCTDLLGILISRLTGVSLDLLLSERVFSPLGMTDTRFFVDAENRHRLGSAYGVGWLTKSLQICDPPEGYWARPPRFLSGGGGLLSTGDDYLRFGRMLLGMGKLGDARVLSRKTVEFMTLNVLTPKQRSHRYFGEEYWADKGFGLSVFVTDDVVRRHAPASIGQYGWRARYGNYWFNDPREDLTALLMISVRWPTPTPTITADFETLVYQAIDD